MLHSVTFGEKNTWDDWGLVPVKQPVFAPPVPKTKYLPINGADGEIDVSTAITGYPVFENRKGSLSFLAPQGHAAWLSTYTEIMAYLHGKKLQAILEDDPAWYYEGRFACKQMAMDEQHGTITIDYVVDPYKWALTTTTDSDWLWDPFSFVDGVIYTGIFTGIALTTTETALEYDYTSAGGAPVKPVFSATGGAVTLYIGSSTTAMINSGASKTVDGLVLYGGSWLLDGEAVTVTAKASSGTATLAIDFRAGRL